MTTIEERYEKSRHETNKTIPCHADWLDLKKSTEIHIRGLKMQLSVAYATLKVATEMEECTRHDNDRAVDKAIRGDEKETESQETKNQTTAD